MAESVLSDSSDQSRKENQLPCDRTGARSSPLASSSGWSTPAQAPHCRGKPSSDSAPDRGRVSHRSSSYSSLLAISMVARLVGWSCGDDGWGRRSLCRFYSHHISALIARYCLCFPPTFLQRTSRVVHHDISSSVHYLNMDNPSQSMV